VVGAALLLAAIPAFVWFLIRAIDGFADIEAHVPADGAAHQISVTADEEKFLWAHENDETDCQIRDLVRGTALTVHALGGTYTRSDSSEAWVAEGRFDSGSGRLAVTCSTSGGAAEIGPAVDVFSFVVTLLLAIGLPFLFGGAGVAVIVVTGVLWAVRPARSR